MTENDAISEVTELGFAVIVVDFFVVLDIGFRRFISGVPWKFDAVSDMMGRQ